MTRISSRPPPLPPLGMLPPTPAAPPQPLPSFEDSVDERTPVSITKPSFGLESAGIGEPPMDAPHVLVVPAIGEEEPLPPPAMLAPDVLFGPDATPSSGPISSGRIPVSVAPPMPQIPKPISSRAPIVQAPGIVSTQAFPLTLPAKKQGRSPLFVAFMFAIIGSMIALAVMLWATGKKPDGSASAQEAPAATSAPSAANEAPPAPSATVSAAAQVTAAPAQTASTTVPSQVRTSSSAKPSAAPSPPQRTGGRKSDRIED